MQQSSINVRSLVLYAVVGLVLLAIIIAGISWAKGRSNQYATQQQGQVAQQNGEQSQNQGVQGGTSSETANASNNETISNSESTAPTPGHIDSAATTGPTQVPAAGSADVFWLLGSVTVAAFAATKFVQSRTRLATIR